MEVWRGGLRVAVTGDLKESEGERMWGWIATAIIAPLEEARMMVLQVAARGAEDEANKAAALNAIQRAEGKAREMQKVANWFGTCRDSGK